MPRVSSNDCTKSESRVLYYVQNGAIRVIVGWFFCSLRLERNMNWTRTGADTHR